MEEGDDGECGLVDPERFPLGVESDDGRARQRTSEVGELGRVNGGDGVDGEPVLGFGFHWEMQLEWDLCVVAIFICSKRQEKRFRVLCVVAFFLLQKARKHLPTASVFH